MISKKKSKFKRQGQRTFINWFIAVPAMITHHGHQKKLKIYRLSRLSGKHHFYKADWEGLDRLLEAA
ncbi:MAG: hypothetical protein A2W90_18495 [Bacteroidetes bacterium GWF2_42_66]|nr:MAG: hypothetical protein A2W89_09995 [Bacteroidetes bacterium GWE2_42_39]OFY42621.1 MAG: hypothetical protein A2W90_18495 [Bacteroidetes bacterium GWF2_42_66]HBL74346.1 hypothetical protein [Prolixibacteraceae bacterium]HCU64116.1 hypothetical protein [Prolixibacteraceae bacterium]